MEHSFFETGWHRFPADPVLADWVMRSLPAARDAVRDPRNAHWLRCGGTWFAGVNVLENDVAGSVRGGPLLGGAAVAFIREMLQLSDIAWDAGQISVCYPGYPQPMESESKAAYQYRNNRDAAHLDGLLPEGPRRRRHLRERHSFLLGLPMVEASSDAAPFVVWERSHDFIRETFRTHFDGLDPGEWGDHDLTDIYQAARLRIFETCTRREVAAKPGEAYLVHRLALHGMAPWGGAAQSGPDGRMIVYFRPQLDPDNWLRAP